MSQKKCKNHANAHKNAQKQRSNCAKTSNNTIHSPDKRDFLALQRHWYTKLAESGFKDLEYFSFKSTNPYAGEPGDVLKGQSLYDMARLRSSENPQETFHYYARLRNYITHNPNWAGNKAINHLVARLYTEGQSYDRIVRAVKEAGLKANMNKWHVHHIVKDFEKKATAWNLKDHRGLDFSSF